MKLIIAHLGNACLFQLLECGLFFFIFCIYISSVINEETNSFMPPQMRGHMQRGHAVRLYINIAPFLYEQFESISLAIDRRPMHRGQLQRIPFMDIRSVVQMLFDGFKVSGSGCRKEIIPGNINPV